MAAPGNAKERLFNAAAELTEPGQRAAFLDAACGHDASLRAEIEDLLRHDDAAAGFLSAPALSPDATSEAGTTEPPLPDLTGSRIGPYKLLQLIGEGGMGTVWMAEQTAPMKRVVALKVIKAGMDSRQVLARFSAERQALALMDHPNIARVLDASATESGRPYFVMELVKGVPITRFCDENRLTPRERLELLILVCQAIQHAHQKGIIHRDLKPSNVLVGLYDGKPVPKVIDFGVAKAAGPKLTEATLFTGFGTVIGTPEYMSPEQAQLDNLDIDTRSDIYSLGVLLYELLTGTTPFTKRDLEKAGILEMLRVIREQEPTRPSTRLSTAEGLPTLAANRGTEPARLTRLVRGELDWIVMKALEKDRSRRYETANSLAMDLQRYLADEPVQACPPSAAYRFRKFARRNRPVLLTVALVAVALVVGALVSVWQAVRARRAEALARTRLESERLAHAWADSARAEAVAQRELARGNLRKARQAVDDMYTQVAEKWLANQPQMGPVQREFLEKSLRFYQEFAQQDDGAEPAVRLETARAYRRVADIHHHIGATAQAETAFREAIVRLRGLVDEFPGSPEHREHLADTLHKLGILFGDIGRISEEEKVHREALALQERLTAEFPTESRYQRALARSHFWLAVTLNGLRKPRDAAAAWDAAIALQEKLAADGSSHPEDREDLAESLSCRDRLIGITGVVQARKDVRRAIDLFEGLAAEFPNVPQYRNELACAYFRMADVPNLVPPPEAEKALREALDIQRKLDADFPGVMYYRYDLVKSLLTLGSLLEKRHRTQEAIDALREAQAISEKLAAETPPAVGYIHNQLGRVYLDLARLLTGAGRVAEANDLTRRAIERSSSAGWLNGEAWGLATHPEARYRNPALAVSMAEKSVALATNTMNLNTLGVARYRNGDWKEAIKALSRSEELAPNDNLGFNAFFLAMAHWQLGERVQAREWYATAVEWMEKNEPSDQELRGFRTEAEELMKKEPGTKQDRP